MHPHINVSRDAIQSAFNEHSTMRIQLGSEEICTKVVS